MRTAQRERAEQSHITRAGEALAALKEPRPDVLISDLGMSEEDGYTLIKKALALFSWLLWLEFKRSGR
jgi:CheY-like chemotaxis protein